MLRFGTAMKYFNINGIFEDAAVYVKMNPRRHSKRVPKA